MVLEDHKAEGTDNTIENVIDDEQTAWKKYFQLYLNEFAYKLNRRHFGERIFDSFVSVSITAKGH